MVAQHSMMGLHVPQKGYCEYRLGRRRSREYVLCYPRFHSSMWGFYATQPEVSASCVVPRLIAEMMPIPAAALLIDETHGRYDKYLVYHFGSLLWRKVYAPPPLTATFAAGVPCPICKTGTAVHLCTDGILYAVIQRWPDNAPAC